MKSDKGAHRFTLANIQEYDVVVQGQSAEKVASEIVRLSASCFMVTLDFAWRLCRGNFPPVFHVYLRQLTLQQRASAPSILDLMMIFFDKVVRTARIKRIPTSSMHHPRYTRYQHPRFLTILDQYTSIRHFEFFFGLSCNLQEINEADAQGILKQPPAMATRLQR